MARRPPAVELTSQMELQSLDQNRIGPYLISCFDDINPM